MSESENLLGRIVSRRALLCVQASAAAEDRNSSDPLGLISNLLVIDIADPLRLSCTLQSEQRDAAPDDRTHGNRHLEMLRVRQPCH